MDDHEQKRVQFINEANALVLFIAPLNKIIQGQGITRDFSGNSLESLNTFVDENAKKMLQGFDEN